MVVVCPAVADGQHGSRASGYSAPPVLRVPTRRGFAPTRSTASSLCVRLRRRMLGRLAVEIVDTQVHLNRIGAGWESAQPQDVIERAIVAMDAVGIDAVLIGESSARAGRVAHAP